MGIEPITYCRDYKSEIITGSALTSGAVGATAGALIGTAIGLRVAGKYGAVACAALGAVIGGTAGYVLGESASANILWNQCKTTPLPENPSVPTKRLFEKNSPDAGKYITLTMSDGTSVKIHYFDFNKEGEYSPNDPVYLGVAGFGSHASQFKELGDLPKRGRVILVDMPGFGYSGPSKDPVGNPDYNFDGKLKEILTQFAKVNDLNNIVWMASSLGGPIVVHALHDNTDLKNRTRQVMLVNSIEGHDEMTYTALQLALVRAGSSAQPTQFMEQAGAVSTLMVNVVPDARQLTQEDVNDFIAPTLGSDWQDKVDARAAYAEQEMDILDSPFEVGLMQDVLFEQPTCIIQGGFDGYSTTETPQQFLDALPKSVLIYMDPENNPLAGHTPMTQVPEDYLAIVDACSLNPSTLSSGNDHYYSFKSDDNSFERIDGALAYY